MRAIQGRARFLVSAGVLVLVLLLVASCHGGYYGQAVLGQTRLLAKREPIVRVLADPSTPGPLRARLELVQEIRDFATTQLSLPDNKSYRSFVALEEGQPVSWTVVAAEEFSTTPRTWCFPIAGCVAYRGYFSRRRAEAFAESLAVEGLDVAVGGVAAYSTLGWFADPVLSSFLERSDADLAGLLFHELSHQVIYVKDDTTFNESFATFVELEGVRRWLAATDREGESASFLEVREHDDQFVELVLETRAELDALYAQALDPGEMRRGKVDRFRKLSASYRAARETWGGDSRYDGWFDQELGNAHVATVGAYNALVPEFRRVFEASGNDFSEFFRRLENPDLVARLQAASRDRGATP